MSTSRIPAVIDALVSTLAAALPTVTVYDGPWVTAPETTDSFVAVGWTPQDDRITGRQNWIGVGPSKVRGEEIDVPCYADAYSGDTTTATRRNAAFALLAAAENALRADPSLGGVLTVPGIAQIDSYANYQEQTEAGLEVGVVFHITCSTRI